MADPSHPFSISQARTPFGSGSGKKPDPSCHFSSPRPLIDTYYRPRREESSQSCGSGGFSTQSRCECPRSLRGRTSITIARIIVQQLHDSVEGRARDRSFLTADSVSLLTCSRNLLLARKESRCTMRAFEVNCVGMAKPRRDRRSQAWQQLVVQVASSRICSYRCLERGSDSQLGGGREAARGRVHAPFCVN